LQLSSIFRPSAAIVSASPHGAIVWFHWQLAIESWKIIKFFKIFKIFLASPRRRMHFPSEEGETWRNQSEKIQSSEATKDVVRISSRPHSYPETGRAIFSCPIALIRERVCIVAV
jgi:hypothetical protein